VSDPTLLLVGGGRLAEDGYLPALAITRGLRLGGVVDPEPGRREQVARAARSAGLGDVPTAATLEDGIAVCAPEMAVIASPVGTHEDHAVALSAAGIPTLVEKPPAPDAAGAARLAALDPAPWVGFNRRFDPGAAAVRDALPSAGHGFELRLGLHYLRRSWGAVGAGDDALLDLGPHLVDWALWITGGTITSVTCSQLTHDRAAVELGLDHGRVLVDAATDRPWRESIELRRASGEIVARHGLGGAVAGALARVRRSAGPSPLVDGLSRQLVALARVATGRDADPRLATARHGAVVMAALDAARASAAQGGAILTPHTEL
jgi:predicted dehydrogenase